MKIAIDISPIKTGHFLQHRVRGTGFYLENLRKSLEKYYPANRYTFFTREDKEPVNVDLVHYPYFEPFFLTLPFKSRNKFIVTVHDLTPLVFPSNFPPGLKGKIKWNIQKNRLRKASAIITDSNSSKKDIVRFVGVSDDRVNVVYLAAGEEFKKLEITKRYSIPERFVLYVGDVTWNKNLPRLIDATVKANIPIVLVGSALKNENLDKENPWNQDLVKVKDLVKNNKSVFVLGFVENKDLVALYNMATVFAMPSVYEGFGLPILEAMSCGAPVVTSREGSIPEIAQEAALYVDAYSVDSIAEGLSKVFKDTKLQKKMSEEGIAQSNKFSWNKTAENTMNVYKKAIA